MRVSVILYPIRHLAVKEILDGLRLSSSTALHCTTGYERFEQLPTIRTCGSPY
jgi:hypothetical protein